MLEVYDYESLVTGSEWCEILRVPDYCVDDSCKFPVSWQIVNVKDLPFLDVMPFDAFAVVWDSSRQTPTPQEIVERFYETWEQSVDEETGEAYWCLM